jgi:hypothetical protein
MGRAKTAWGLTRAHLRKKQKNSLGKKVDRLENTKKLLGKNWSRRPRGGNQGVDRLYTAASGSVFSDRGRAVTNRT